jgi:hypothetical protein
MRSPGASGRCHSFFGPARRSGASRFRDFSLMRELDPPANASPRRVPTGDAKGQG